MPTQTRAQTTTQRPRLPCPVQTAAAPFGSRFYALGHDNPQAEKTSHQVVAPYRIFPELLAQRHHVRRQRFAAVLFGFRSPSPWPELSTASVDGRADGRRQDDSSSWRVRSLRHDNGETQRESRMEDDVVETTEGRERIPYIVDRLETERLAENMTDVGLC